MIKRLLIAALIATAVTAAWLAPAADSPVPSVPTSTTEPSPATAQAFSTCPWAFADDAKETLISIVTERAIDVQLTFPVAGEIRETYPETLPGPGASAVPLSPILSLGTAPAVVEFSEAPAAAGVVVLGDGGLAADLCPSRSSKVWVLPGGSTAEGRTLDLQLFNPFPEDARVTIEVVSEEGFEPVTDLEALSVPGRSWRTVAMHDVLPFRQNLSVTLQTEQGLVIPAMIRGNGPDQAVWTDVGRSEVWEFPLVTAGQLVPSMALANEGALEVSWVIDVFTADGPEEAVVEGSVPPDGQVQVPLLGLSDSAFAVRVRADGPLAAVVVGESEGRVAATTGAPLTASRWLLPGAGSDSSARHSLWLLNSGSDQITVTYSMLDASGLVDQPGKIALPSGAVRRLVLDTVGLSGVVAEANGPFSIAWSAESEGSVAFSSGVPVG